MKTVTHFGGFGGMDMLFACVLNAFQGSCLKLTWYTLIYNKTLKYIREPHRACTVLSGKLKSSLIFSILFALPDILTFSSQLSLPHSSSGFHSQTPMAFDCLG